MSKQTRTMVAVVTGATGGLGNEITRRLLLRGDYVIGVDVSEENLIKQQSELETFDGRFIPVAGDISLPLTWKRLQSVVDSGPGVVTTLVNNAGISPKHDGKKLDGIDIPLEEWAQVVAVNLTGAFLGIQSVARGMMKTHYGRIVNVASVAARYGGRLGGVHYAATKTGLLGLTRSFAQELASFGVTVNAVAPGRINSGMAAMVTDEVNADYASTIPVGRLGEAWDVANAVDFLTRETASFITGVTLDVNGGSHMQ